MVKAYLICPVRGASAEQRAAMEKYVAEREDDGEYEFHLPHRDVEQEDDSGGYRICLDHCYAMMDCDEVHVWLGENNRLSQGSVFDLGMAFMFWVANGKGDRCNFRFFLANGTLVRGPYKSFENVLVEAIREQSDRISSV